VPIKLKERSVIKLVLKNKKITYLLCLSTVCLISISSELALANRQPSALNTNSDAQEYFFRGNQSYNDPGSITPIGNYQSFIDTQQKSGDYTSINPDLGMVTMDPAELSDFKNKLNDQLFIVKKNGRELMWPSFPRVWTERSIVEQKNINVGNSGGINPFSVGLKFKFNLSNQYTLKTTFVMISSTKPNDAKLYDETVGEYPILRNIYKTGPDNLVYPNVENNFPIVGFCSFEAKYVVEKQNQFSASFFTFDAEKLDIYSEPVSYYITSKLFQINSKISVKHYLHSVCGEIFTQKIEEKVMQDFDKIKHEMEFHAALDTLNIRSGLCQPSTSEDQNLQKNETADDESCSAWHKSHFTSAISDRSIARCAYDENKKNNYCVLKAKENHTCPMYWNTKTKTYESDVSKTSRTAISATDGYNELACDTTNGFECRFTRKPIFLLNIPFLQGRAVCIRVSK
jgi:hypothetical protein